jgi:hypothetical protein
MTTTAFILAKTPRNLVVDSSGDLVLSADATFDTNTLYVDSDNNRVGIGTLSPAQALDVNGNIVLSGTVDGRDIATDGSKLDGIESGATADQTGAEIKSLYEAEANTNAFTDALQTKLSGIETGADVTDTANVTAAGALMDSELTNLTAVKAINQGLSTSDSPDFASVTVNGDAVLTTATDLSNASTLDLLDSTQFLRSDAADTKTSGDLSFSDNVKAQFGTGNDLQIYHDGSNSYISEQGTGSLKLLTSFFTVKNSLDTKQFLNATNNGAVKLFYDDNLKIETTATGVEVTGSITVSGTVDGRDIATDGSKLDGIESGATADQTGSEIKALYEVEANAFTDAQFTKLAGIETGADVTDTANVTAAGALMDSELTNEAAVKAINQGLTTTSNVNFNDVTLAGNLIVNGTTTTVNSNTVEIGDSIITLNADEAGTPSQNAGIEIERGTSANKTLVWDETADKWTVGSETFVASAFEGNLTGNVTGTVSDISNHNTGDLAEGSNLYYTSVRANSAIDTRVDKSFVDALNIDADTLDGNDSTAFATAAQGTKADSALQSSDIGSSVQAHSTVLDNTTASYTTAEETKLSGIEANATADQTASEILTAIKTVDGSGSGLDADLLEGQQGTYYTQTVTDTALTSSDDLNSLTDGYYSWITSQPSNSPGDPYMILLQVTDGGQPQQLAWGGSSNGKIYMRRRDSGTWNTWTKVWTDANDGSGSGLDADLLDGIHAASLLRSDATDSATGIITFSNSTASTNDTTGAVIVTGGVGIGGALNVGGTITGPTTDTLLIKNSAGTTVKTIRGV